MKVSRIVVVLLALFCVVTAFAQTSEYTNRAEALTPLSPVGRQFHCERVFAVGRRLHLTFDVTSPSTLAQCIDNE